MNKTIVVLGSIMALAIAAPLLTAQADSDDHNRGIWRGIWQVAKSSAVTDPLTQQECSECHIAYPPRLLSAEAWKGVMGNLSNHFGEDASLDANTRQQIETYLVGNASRSSAPGKLRISEQSWFIHEHQDEVSPRKFAQAKTWSNCQSCHKDAAKGLFDDDD
ncbi:MAG: diheme cytochrome c [Magnetovibrio sp.]|nr:diheme cytochrome c [Magnetovibrio sp.]